MSNNTQLMRVVNGLFQGDFGQFCQWFQKATGKQLGIPREIRHDIANDIEKIRQAIGQIDLRDTDALSGLLSQGRQLSSLYRRASQPLSLDSYLVYDSVVVDLHIFTDTDLAVVKKLLASTKTA